MFVLEYQSRASGNWTRDLAAGSFPTKTQADSAKGTRESGFKKVKYRVVEVRRIA
jgi:hypothetical protein